MHLYKSKTVGSVVAQWVAYARSHVRVAGWAEFAVTLCPWVRPLPTCVLSRPRNKWVPRRTMKAFVCLNSFQRRDGSGAVYAPQGAEMAYK